MRFFSSIFLTIAATCISIHAQVVDEIVAVVEDNIILQSDVDIQVRQMAAQGAEMPEEMSSCMALEQFVIERMFQVQAERDSVIVSEDEVESELNRRIQYFISMFGTEQKLEEYYGKSVFEIKEEFREDISDQLLAERMRSRIFEDVEVTPEEVRGFFHTIPPDSLPFFNAEVEVGQVVIFAKPDALQKQAAREKAESIRQDILNGSDFEFQALLYSEDPGSASNGGDLGFVQRGELVPAFEAAAFRLEPGEISDVVETPFGFHIIQLIEKLGNRIHARHILITPEIGEQNLAAARRELETVRDQLVEGEMTFQEAVSEHSEDDLSKNNGGLIVNPETGNNFFEMDQLDGSLSFLIEPLGPGDFTEIVPYESMDGKQGFRVITLVSETPAHKANLDDDYSKIKGVAKQARQSEMLDEWLRERSRDVYVRMDEQYRSCPNLGWLSHAF